MSSSALNAEVYFFLSFFRRQLTAEGTSVVNCNRFLTSVVNCRRGIFVFYMCFSALSYVSTTIFTQKCQLLIALLDWVNLLKIYFLKVSLSFVGLGI